MKTIAGLLIAGLLILSLLTGCAAPATTTTQCPVKPLDTPTPVVHWGHDKLENMRQIKAACEQDDATIVQYPDGRIAAIPCYRH